MQTKYSVLLRNFSKLRLNFWTTLRKRREKLLQMLLMCMNMWFQPVIDHRQCNELNALQAAFRAIEKPPNFDDVRLVMEHFLKLRMRKLIQIKTWTVIEKGEIELEFESRLSVN